MARKALSLHRRAARRKRPKLHGERNGSSSQWRRLRAYHLRENPLCAFCDGGATEVDHITPLSAGGMELDADNLRSVCRKCHDVLTATYRRTGKNVMRVGGGKSLERFPKTPIASFTRIDA